MELKEGIKQINQSVTQSSASDATLEGYMLELKDANGNLVDKQPVSKIESLVYNYLTTKRQSELTAAVEGDQNGYADGFVKFINTFIDDTIDNPRPNGIYPLVGENPTDRGFVFRFFSNKHNRAIEIRYIEQQLPSFRIYVGGMWSEWIGIPSFYKNYPDIASLSSAISLQPVLEGVNDNVFILFHRKSDNYPLMVNPHKWASYQNSGEIATGVAVVAGERILVVAPTETSAYWSSAAVNGGGKITTERLTALGDFEGKANTASQITHAECSSASYAPGYCAQYSRTNANGQGLTAGSWWLPSMGEFMMVCANMRKINYALSLISGATQLAETWYWCSTEFSADTSWYLAIDSGRVYNTAKEASLGRVRPVSSISLNLPSFYKDYPDIASLAGGIRPQTIKNGGSERIYKIGVIPQGYNPFCYNFWVAGTNAAKPVECTLIVGDEGTGKGLADNVVMYKDWGAGEFGVSNFVEIAVVTRTVYLVCKADVSITFGEYVEEVTGVDLSSAYNVPFKKIPTFYKDYNSLSELKDALKAIW